MKSTNENLLLWEQQIKKRKQSGLKIQDWCNKNGISTHQYHYWNRRIREIKKNKTVPEIVFTEIPPVLLNATNAETLACSGSDFQLFIKNVQITVPSGFIPEALARLIKVLQEL